MISLCRLGCLVGVASCTVMVLPAGAAPSLYTATELPPLSGYDNARARAINNLGVIAGTSSDSTEVGPVTVWDGVQTLDLGRPTACGSMTPRAINDAGKIVGRCDEFANANGFAWRWDGDSFQFLSGTVVSNEFYNAATDVNEAGVACGWETFTLDAWALGWDALGTPVPLTPPGVPEGLSVRRARAVHVTESGQVVGYYNNWDGDAYFFAWENGVLTEITPDTEPPVNLTWELHDANDGMTLVGSTGALPAEGFVLSGGVVASLEPLSGHTSTRPSAVNESGDIVGRSYVSFSEPRAVVWPSSGGVYDLNDLVVAPIGFVLEFAEDVNDHGEIVGWSHDAGTGEYRAFLLEPLPPVAVPEVEQEAAGRDRTVAWPNPFGPELASVTTFAFDLSGATDVTIDVVDVSGRRRALLRRETLAAGRHTVDWNGRDASGRWLPAGAYWLRVRGDHVEAVAKVILRR